MTLDGTLTRRGVFWFDILIRKQEMSLERYKSHLDSVPSTVTSLGAFLGIARVCTGYLRDSRSDASIVLCIRALVVCAGSCGSAHRPMRSSG